jgi:hypothetical protein
VLAQRGELIGIVAQAHRLGRIDISQPLRTNISFIRSVARLTARCRGPWRLLRAWR